MVILNLGRAYFDAAWRARGAVSNVVRLAAARPQVASELLVGCELAGRVAADVIVALWICFLHTHGLQLLLAHALNTTNDNVSPRPVIPLSLPHIHDTA